MADKRRDILERAYGLDVRALTRLSGGAGGETYRVEAAQGDFVFKIADRNAMNHPEREPALCAFLQERGVPVAAFQKARDGQYLVALEDGRLGHLQRFVPGTCCAMHRAEPWYMAETPVLLARIHRALAAYPALPAGIGADFFRRMTPERAMQSYRHSLETARAAGEARIVSDLEARMRAVERVRDWRFDLSRLTVCNTHGDYTVHQILCGEREILAVIDWTSACRHPVVWELARSFFHAEPGCADGACAEDGLRDYAARYGDVAPLTRYDRENLTRLYFYQLAVCDYYAQYFAAPRGQKAAYLQQAVFATKVLRQL